jgi:hypothetical protein
LDLCVALGIGVKSHSSSVVEPQADRVRRKAEREGLVRDVQPEEPEAPAKKAAQRSGLVVRADEKPWTASELAEVKGTLQEEKERLRGEIAYAQAELDELLRDSGDGSGDDQADAGSKTFEREAEMSVANNSRDLLVGWTEIEKEWDARLIELTSSLDNLADRPSG